MEMEMEMEWKRIKDDDGENRSGGLGRREVRMREGGVRWPSSYHTLHIL